MRKCQVLPFTFWVVLASLTPFPLACAARAPVAQPASNALDQRASKADNKERSSHEHEFWIAPSGSDSNSGKSPKSPWKTFDYAIPKLKPGDSLILRDGTYDVKNTGYIDVNCTHGSSNGRPDARITIKAENERKAFLQGAGNTYPVQVQNCSFWKIEGLHVENGDFKNNGAKEAKYADVMFLYRDSFLTVRRNLLARNNRYANSHLIDNYYTVHSLYEENEFYYFHRHGILDMYGDYNEYRRNYFNSRSYADLPDGRYSADPERGDTAISLYPASDALLENNITEWNQVGFDIQCAYESRGCHNNRFFGNISLHDTYGRVYKARGPDDEHMPHDTFSKDDVVISPRSIAFYTRGSKNTVCENCTFIGGGTAKGGLIADAGSKGEKGDGTFSLFVSRSLSLGFTDGVGFSVAVGDGSWIWKMRDIDAYGNRENYDPPPPQRNLENAFTKDPRLGNCQVWVPVQSTLKKAATQAVDIGANILYRYEGAQLSTVPLWDRSTGEFPHGAVIPGLNDVPGQSAFDVNKRLNVNSNGCTFPPGY
ncbi:MAG TPA: right-handed parallel beta-helix repeat-containing protein [Candidatus Acidoferrales bacterium]|nr:right-handed parallel beta-helix repeat-containing protein [Candidatus Acidoferrales bacterium]